MPAPSCQPPPARPKRVRGERQRLQDVQLRQRKKLERQQLRETAQQLEGRLNQLQQSTGLLNEHATTGSPLHKKRKSVMIESDWQAKAEAAKQGRFQAEHLNMTLRRALIQEQKVAKSLRTTMAKTPFIPRSVMNEMRRANSPQVETRSHISQCLQCCNPTTLHLNPVAVRRELEATLQQMHTQVNAALNFSTSDDSLAFNFDVRLDPVAGPTTEVTTTTPMNCTVEQAVRLLGPKIQVQNSHCGGDAREQQLTVELGAPYQTVLLDGFGCTRKFDDHGRRLILWAAIFFDRCGALCFRECTWLAVHRSTSNPENESVVRSQYCVSAEKAMGCTVIDGEHIDLVRNRALRAMGRQIKERYLAMQRGILARTGRGDLVGFIGV